MGLAGYEQDGEMWMPATFNPSGLATCTGGLAARLRLATRFRLAQGPGGVAIRDRRSMWQAQRGRRPVGWLPTQMNALLPLTLPPVLERRSPCGLARVWGSGSPVHNASRCGCIRLTVQRRKVDGV